MSRAQPRRDLYGTSRYANEVGEAFRSLVPAAVVWLSYGVASSYVLADAIDKGKKAGEVSLSSCVVQSAALLVIKSLWDTPVPTTLPSAVHRQSCL
uniref:Mitochondrial fission process protein 1 n=1 Tax=Cercocebus atys TaxID=9531 RepID=A0A2K5L0C8_CERAT